MVFYPKEALLYFKNKVHTYKPGLRVRAMGVMMLADDIGQSNVDFLFGVGVFLLTFLYVATFIPGLFVPYQPGAIDLSSVAYRTSAILAEDPGWFSNVATNGTEWENNVNDLSRIGLADDKDHPNVLSIDKVSSLNAILSNPSNYGMVRDHMGLHGNVEYDINVSVKMADTGQELLTSSAAWPTPNSNRVESMERKVMVDNGKELFVDCNSTAEIGHPSNSELIVNVANTTNKDKGIIIRIYNVSAMTPISFDKVQIGADAGEILLDKATDYRVTLNGVVQTTQSFNFMKGDIVEVTVFKSTFDTYPVWNYIGIYANSSTFPGRPVYYTGDSVFKTRNVYYPAKLKLEVWSYEFN